MGQEKLVELTNRLRDLFLELKHTSQKYNTQKPLKNYSTLMEDQLFASVTSFFDKYKGIIRSQQKIFQENIGNFSKYFKEYIGNVKAKVYDRNFLSNEYYKNKISLNEKKNKKVVLDHA